MPTLHITDAGRDVLSGRLDRVGVNGIDLWRGGLHLAGADRSPWRSGRAPRNVGIMKLRS